MTSDARSYDRKLLDALSDGDSSAFWLIWLRHEPHLGAVCRRHMRRMQPDAEDAVSRSMMTARERLPQYAANIIDLEAWLTRLTSNVCLDLKKERCRGTRRADPLDEEIVMRREATLPVPPSPEDACLASQMRAHRRCLLQAAARPRRRGAVALHQRGQLRHDRRAVVDHRDGGAEAGAEGARGPAARARHAGQRTSRVRNCGLLVRSPIDAAPT